jgi:hypothetical protein
VSYKRPIVPAQSRDDSLELVDSALSIGSLQDTSDHSATVGGHSAAAPPTSATSAPVPELPRFLQDPKGKFSKS